MPRIRGSRSHSLPKANGFSIAMWKAESHYNECPSGAIAQLTFLCKRSDSLVSYDIVFSKKRKFMRFSKSWHDSSPMSSAIQDGSERSLPFLRFCWNFNGYGLRSASFSLKYRPIRRGWCCLWKLHRYRPLSFEVFDIYENLILQNWFSFEYGV